MYAQFAIVANLLNRDICNFRVRKISFSVTTFRAGVHLDDITEEIVAARQSKAMSCLDGLATLLGQRLEIKVLASGLLAAWKADISFRLADPEAVRLTLDLVFDRLAALQSAGYKRSLTVDPKYRCAYNLEDYLTVQEFKYVFTPDNAEFPQEGYTNKMTEVSSRRTLILMSIR